MDFRQDQYSWPVNPTFMLVKLSGHTLLPGRHCGGSFPPRHWFPPVGTGEASAYPPSGASSLGVGFGPALPKRTPGRCRW